LRAAYSTPCCLWFVRGSSLVWQTNRGSCGRAEFEWPRLGTVALADECAVCGRAGVIRIGTSPQFFCAVPIQCLFSHRVRLRKPPKPLILLVPAEGFEPPTFGLQNRCTTTVLSRLKGKTRTRFGLEHRSPQGCGSYVRFQLAASTHMIVQSRRAFVSATQP
jgi:hypothetical protein